MNKGIKYVIVGLVAAALAVFTIRALKMDTDSVEVSAISEQETIEAAPSKQDTSGVEKTPSVKKDANMTETAQVDLTGLDLENVLFLDVSVGGRVVIETYPDKAPAHVARFKELVRAGFYDGIVFHRVIDGFMAQTGDPSGTGAGGSGQNIKAEFNDIHHARGIVSTARSGHPDSADSQFFIMLGDAPHLDGQYTAWGRVIAGMDYIDRIKKGPPHANGEVEEPRDYIEHFTVAADAE